MTRLTRIVCDNPDCKAQVERFADDYYREMVGIDDTPLGWYRLTHLASYTLAESGMTTETSQPRSSSSIPHLPKPTAKPHEPRTRASRCTPPTREHRGL